MISIRRFIGILYWLTTQPVVTKCVFDDHKSVFNWIPILHRPIWQRPLLFDCFEPWGSHSFHWTPWLLPVIFHDLLTQELSSALRVSKWKRCCPCFVRVSPNHYWIQSFRINSSVRFVCVDILDHHYHIFNLIRFNCSDWIGFFFHISWFVLRPCLNDNFVIDLSDSLTFKINLLDYPFWIIFNQSFPRSSCTKCHNPSLRRIIFRGGTRCYYVFLWQSVWRVHCHHSPNVFQVSFIFLIM